MFIICMTFQLIITLNSKLSIFNYKFSTLN